MNPPSLICDSDGGNPAGFVVDATPLGKARRLPNGFLRAPANLTRAGVLIYRLTDGSTRRELRPPEEVFSADSLATLEMVTLTLEHPEPIGTPVTADNAKELGVGHLGESFDRAGDVLAGKVVVTDAEAIRQVEAGERREVSLGYWRDLDRTPGIWNGLKYDAIQRNIRYNHAAITKRGRAGPEVRIRLDSETAVLVGDAADEPQPPTGADAMKFKITIDGITHEIECADSTGSTIQKALGDRDQKLAALDTAVTDARKRADEAQAKADALEAEKKKLTQQVTDATSADRIAELVELRLDLEREADRLLNADRADDDKVDISKMTDVEIKKAVILLDDADAKLDDVSDDYLAARYDAAASHLTLNGAPAKMAADSRAKVRAAVAAPKAKIKETADKARERMIADTHDAWKKGLPGFEDDKQD